MVVASWEPSLCVHDGVVQGGPHRGVHRGRAVCRPRPQSDGEEERGVVGEEEDKQTLICGPHIHLF